jgi:very-short-patch-repair endonuclease
MDKAKPDHPTERPARNERPNNRPYLQTFRTELRKSLTPAEARLWTALKNSQLGGRKFRRQHSVGGYILDFYCPAERLAVELDGQVHKGEFARAYDYDRKLFLEFYRISVIRFENFLVFEDIDFVLGNIQACFGWWETESDAC